MPLVSRAIQRIEVRADEPGVSDVGRFVSAGFLPKVKNLMEQGDTSLVLILSDFIVKELSFGLQTVEI